MALSSEAKVSGYPSLSYIQSAGGESVQFQNQNAILR